jgi:hypothetical protein
MPPDHLCPFKRAEAGGRAAVASGSVDAALQAQRPWAAAGGREGALKVIEEILRARPDMRATGGSQG